MPNLNKVFLMGHLTRDPELRTVGSGTAVCSFGIAVSRKFGGKDGLKEETAFVDCTAWGRSAEVINQYMRKGSALLVEGRLTYQAWENQEGQKRSKLLVTVENFQFVGGKGSEAKAPAGEPEGEDAAF